MRHIIVIEFTTLDGVVGDPDGTEGTPYGGWAFRHGPQAVAGDKFRLGATMETGTLLLGRRTWEKFAGLWPTRDDPFSQRMNAMRKLVVSTDGVDLAAWSNSARLDGDVADLDGEVVVAGSLSVARSLASRGLVDEYRLLVFPTVAGTGARLFDGAPPAELQLTGCEQTGPAALLRYARG